MNEVKKRKRGEGRIFQYKNPDGSLKSPYWYVKYYAGGKPHVENTKSTREKDAVKLLRTRLGQADSGIAVNPKVGKVTMKEGLDAVVADLKVNHPKSVEHTERRIKLHLTPYFGEHRRMAANSMADVTAYVAARLEAGAEHATINRELAILRRAYRLAIDGNLLVGMPRIKMLRENNVRRGFFEREEFEKVRENLPEALRPLVTLAYYTGWRKAELLSLEWRQVDLAAGTVTLDTSKNGEGRTFVFDGLTEVQTILQKQRKLPVVTPFVFHRNGKQISSIGKAWTTACKAAKVPGRLLHDFRRTAVRNMVRRGIPERVAMAISGHKTRSIFDRYNIVSGHDLREAAAKLNEGLG
jgi:integrase